MWSFLQWENSGTLQALWKMRVIPVLLIPQQAWHGFSHPPGSSREHKGYSRSCQVNPQPTESFLLILHPWLSDFSTTFFFASLYLCNIYIYNYVCVYIMSFCYSVFLSLFHTSLSCSFSFSLRTLPLFLFEPPRWKDKGFSNSHPLAFTVFLV